MKTIHCLLIALLCVAACVPVQAGPKSDARLVRRAVQAIQQAPVPPCAAGVAYSRELRFNWIPFLPPLGAFAKAGRGVAFDREQTGQLSNPRFVRNIGGGVTATIGVGVPWSIGTTERVIAFRSRADTHAWATNTYIGGHLTPYVAAGVPGKLWAYSLIPAFDERPGTEVWRRERFVGLFASAGVSAGVDVQYPQTK